MCSPDTEVSKAEFRRKFIWRRLNDLVFGYDFFISYACSDGRRYAVGLAEQTGLIDQLGPVLLRNACLHARAEAAALARLLAGLLDARKRGEPAESLDRRLEEGLVEAAPDELRREAEREIANRLASFRDRMAADVFDATRRAALIRRLRVALGLRRLG